MPSIWMLCKTLGEQSLILWKTLNTCSNVQKRLCLNSKYETALVMSECLSGRQWCMEHPMFQVKGEYEVFLLWSIPTFSLVSFTTHVVFTFFVGGGLGCLPDYSFLANAVQKTLIGLLHKMFEVHQTLLYILMLLILL